MPVEKVLRIPLRMPRDEREWSAFIRGLGDALGYTWDGTNFVLDDSTTTESRSATTLNLITQRLGDAGTGNDTRLLPVAKTANLGSAIVGANPLTAADVGADVTITLAAFTAQFDFGTRTVTGATITGLAYSTTGNVVLTDFDYSDGSYTAAVFVTTDAETTDDPALFYVGTITTPAAAAPPTGGTGGGGHYEP